MKQLIHIHGKEYFLLTGDSDLEKAKKAAIGETATWADGKTYRKVSESNWEPVSDHDSRHRSGSPTGGGGAGGADKDDVSTPSKLHEKFRVALEAMSSEHRALFRGGKMDFDKKTFSSPDGKISLYYKDGKVTASKMEKADDLNFMDDVSVVAGSNFEIGSFDLTELAMGIQVEMEHTDDVEVAWEIATDHLDADKKYYSKLMASGLIDEDLSNTSDIIEILKKIEAEYTHEAEQVMNKARTVKYIRRIPNPSGKGYLYFYNKAEYEHYKNTGKLPEKTRSVFSQIMSFFGLGSEKEAKEKIDRLYTSHKSVLADIDKKTFSDHVIEYISNKQKWDKKLSAKESKTNTPKEPKKESPKEHKDTKGKTENNNSVKFNTQIMRLVAGIVNEKDSDKYKFSDNGILKDKDGKRDFEVANESMADLIVRKYKEQYGIDIVSIKDHGSFSFQKKENYDKDNEKNNFETMPEDDKKDIKDEKIDNDINKVKEEVVNQENKKEEIEDEEDKLAKEEEEHLKQKPEKVDRPTILGEPGQKYWNGKIYGNEKYGYRVYIDQDERKISKDTMESLEKYAKYKKDLSGWKGRKEVIEGKKIKLKNKNEKFQQMIDKPIDHLKKIAEDHFLLQLDRMFIHATYMNDQKTIIVDSEQEQKLIDRIKDWKPEDFKDLMRERVISSVQDEGTKKEKEAIMILNAAIDKSIDKNFVEHIKNVIKSRIIELKSEQVNQSVKMKEKAEKDKIRQDKINEAEKKYIQKGYWNGKIYGRHGNYSIYVDNKKRDIDNDTAVELMGGEEEKPLSKASLLLEQALLKAKKAPVGEVRTYANGKKYRKEAEGKWVEVKGEKKGKGNDEEKKPEDKKKDEEKKSKNEGEKGWFTDTLKKVANVLAEALKGRDTVTPAGQAVESTGDKMKGKNTQQPPEKDKSKEKVKLTGNPQEKNKDEQQKRKK